jgi:hypothetical protein
MVALSPPVFSPFFDATPLFEAHAKSSTMLPLTLLFFMGQNGLSGGLFFAHESKVVPQFHALPQKGHNKKGKKFTVSA